MNILWSLMIVLALWGTPVAAAPSSPGSSCKAFFHELFIRERPPLTSAELDQVAAGLIEIKIADLSAGTEKVPASSLALVRFSNGFYIRGEIGTIKMADDYHLISIKESSGKIHVIDPNSQAKLYFASPEQQKSVRKLKMKKLELPYIQVDTPRIKKLVCADLPVNDPEYRRREALIRPYLTLERRRQIAEKAKKGCLYSGYGLHGGMAFWVLSAMPRELGYFQDNYLMQHASNFYLTPIVMGAVHNCFASVFPQHYRLALGGAVATGVAAQVVEEVNLGDEPLFATIGNHKRKETDWEDFSAGIAGLSAYVAGAMILDHAMGLNLKKFCQ